MSFEKIRKLLNLTRSENDAEALAAVRRANTILNSAGMTWDDFFFEELRFADASAPFEEWPNILQDDHIDVIVPLFEDILNDNKSSDATKGFVESLCKYAFERRKFSQKQWSAFIRTYESVLGLNFNQAWRNKKQEIQEEYVYGSEDQGL